MGYVEVQFIQHMITPDGTVLHQWDAVATVVFVWDEAKKRYIELRWHASLRGDAAGSGKLATVLARAVYGKAGALVMLVLACLVALLAVLIAKDVVPDYGTKELAGSAWQMAAKPLGWA